MFLTRFAVSTMLASLLWVQIEIPFIPAIVGSPGEAVGIGRPGTPGEVAAASLPCADGPEHTCSYSALWGTSGEKWKAAGPLPDFSYAGYHAGEAKIPSPRAQWDLKRDFHAAGDGQTDDTQALLKAIKSIKSGVLFIPKGTYVISNRIDITRGNLIMRGAGPNETILSFPKSLSDLFGNKAKAGQQSQWAFRPGLINVIGNDPITADTKLVSVTAGAKRGDRFLTITTPNSIQKGQWIRLVENDPPKESAVAGSLVRFLYGDMIAPGTNLIGTPAVVRFLSRVKSVSGGQLELERPLPYDVRPEWTPELHRFVPSVQEVGIEHLSIHFPWSAYPGHFKENGYNGIFFTGVAQSWIDDVEVQNSDIGIDLDPTNFCTVSNVKLTVSASRAVGEASQGMNGHHGIDIGHGTENLVTNFDVQTKFVHDISVEWYALHTVFSKGRGIDLNMDHHREANYSSLFSDIDCGAGTRPFDSGGSRDRGAHSGAYSTYWNIRATSPMPFPASDFGPLLNLIGVHTKVKDPASPYRWMIEQPAGKELCPRELHEAMKAQRLKALKR
jgi:Pectate lyase superfamily protein